ncbi:siderophore-interacting protein [Clavibacter sepedonicus]|uniref:Iron-chelating protein n=1 Tax=Clavibacter sepedonicus TaxID=31964 RepID=B0RE22_CLASE|nr:MULTISPECIES: siderophore-interacting protein [Clavibacter]MBD5382732.1 siderophore-interacting protein [Clavibacter sp.]OQJ47628.1 siderophore-interacting protein [Clavibacter sepedonicus]OQJ53183.1 siderophore-interacting protein [Clavibacter sepedonicus]UUK64342.1 siderophore-interacting protein [Clavibacter sepedonicus]CAQ01983.1 putative iron-chelating protein [Clavibacter sepedonicus]
MTDSSAPAVPDRPVRAARTQHVLEVVRAERLTPHLVRVHLGGEGMRALLERAAPERLAATDAYVKLMLPPRGSGLTPPYDLPALRETRPAEALPAVRTYTLRHADPAAGTCAIDFVVHGDEGLAGPWAASAQPGDLLAASGPGGMYRPSEDAAIARVLLGDDSAVPAIAAALAAMPADATGVALLEVDGPDDELPLAHPSGVAVRWIHRSRTPDAVPGAPLVAAARALERPDGEVEVFAHGERGAMKELRAVLQDGWGIDRRALSLSAYWALGRAEDRFQAEKREPVGVIFGE